MNTQQMILLRHFEGMHSRFSSRYSSRVILPGEPGSRFQTRHTNSHTYRRAVPMDYEDDVAEISDYDIYYGDAPGHEHDRGPIGWIERADGTEIKVCETSTENGNKVYVAAELTESMNGEIIFPGDVIPPEELTAQPPSVIGPQPPINAEFILHLLLRRDEQEAVIGDLLERYPKKYERLGKRRAQLWFCVEVFRSTWPLVKRIVFKATSLITLGKWIRRHIL